MSARLGSTEEFGACLDLLCREWPRTPLALVLVEIDGYLWLAARHGPRRAQHCLGVAATILQDCVRSPLATVYRLEAARFGVLLPCTDEPTARELAERIRRAIAAQVSLLDGRVVRMTAKVALSARGPDEPAEAASMRREAEHGLFGAVT